VYATDLKIDQVNEKKYIEFLLAIDKEIFENSWSKQQWVSEFENSFVLIYLMNIEEKHAGFMSVSVVDQVLEIRKIGILPAYQRQGLASVFMNKIYELCREKEIKKIILEVNEKNRPAVLFYEKNGFQIFHQRRNYYAQNQNAVCMQNTVE